MSKTRGQDSGVYRMVVNAHVLLQQQRQTEQLWKLSGAVSDDRVLLTLL